MDGEDKVSAERIYIFGVMTVVGEIIALPIIFIDTASIGSKPQHTAAVFIDGNHIVVAEALGKGGIISIMDKAFSDSGLGDPARLRSLSISCRRCLHVNH